jgi:hypothetical protein
MIRRNGVPPPPLEQRHTGPRKHIRPPKVQIKPYSPEWCAQELVRYTARIRGVQDEDLIEALSQLCVDFKQMNALLDSVIDVPQGFLLELKDEKFRRRWPEWRLLRLQRDQGRRFAMRPVPNSGDPKTAALDSNPNPPPTQLSTRMSSASIASCYIRRKTWQDERPYRGN